MLPIKECQLEHTKTSRKFLLLPKLRRSQFLITRLSVSSRHGRVRNDPVTDKRDNGSSQ